MSAAMEEVAATDGEPTWQQLTTLESVHREIQRAHAGVQRNLDQACSAADRSELQAAWNQYRAVVAELSRITEEMESLRSPAPAHVQGPHFICKQHARGGGGTFPPIRHPIDCTGR